MKDKTKVALASLVVLVVIAVIAISLPPQINPPEILESEVVIDLASPIEGIIHASSDNTAFAVLRTVLSQYYIPYKYEEYYTYRYGEYYKRSKSAYHFFALNGSEAPEFKGPVYVLRLEPFQLLYEKANITIIFPEGYDIIYQNMVGTFKEGETYKSVKSFAPLTQPVLEDGRWNYFISSDELRELARLEGFESIELVYVEAGK